MKIYSRNYEGFNDLQVHSREDREHHAGYTYTAIVRLMVTFGTVTGTAITRIPISKTAMCVYNWGIRTCPTASLEVLLRLVLLHLDLRVQGRRVLFRMSEVISAVVPKVVGMLSRQYFKLLILKNMTMTTGQIGREAFKCLSTADTLVLLKKI